MIRKFFLFILGMIVLGAVLSGISEKESSEKSLTAEEIAEKAEREREFQESVAIVRAIKSSMNNPASFELVSAMLTTEGVLCVVFRGTNAFGGVVTGRYTFKNGTVDSSSAASWNKHCGGKTGRDMKHVRYAM